MIFSARYKTHIKSLTLEIFQCLISVEQHLHPAVGFMEFDLIMHPVRRIGRFITDIGKLHGQHFGTRLSRYGITDGHTIDRYIGRDTDGRRYAVHPVHKKIPSRKFNGGIGLAQKNITVTRYRELAIGFAAELEIESHIDTGYRALAGIIVFLHRYLVRSIVNESRHITVGRNLRQSRPVRQSRVRPRRGRELVIIHALRVSPCQT